MNADSSGGEALQLPAAQFRELRSYLELEFAKQHDLLSELIHRSSLPVGPLPSEEWLCMLSSPKQIEEHEETDHSIDTASAGSDVRSPTRQESTRSKRDHFDSSAGSDVANRSPTRQERKNDQSFDIEKASAGSSVANTSRKGTIVWHENHMAQAQQQAEQLTLDRTVSGRKAKTTWRTQLKLLVSSDRFNNTIMFLIMANVVLMGVEVDVSATLGQDEIPAWFNTVNTAIVVIFVVETLLKHLAFGCAGFWCGSDYGWNIFDFAIVLVSVAEVGLDIWARSADANSGQVRMLRTVRLIRALRGMRLVRLFRYVVALRTLLLSIIATTGSLFWTFLLFLMLSYSFGMAITQFALDQCRLQAIEQTMDPNAVPDCPEALRKYWSSVPDSMLTLFLAICGGISWDEAFRPIRQFSVVGTVLLLLYIFIAVFAILNVVTGVFCNTAIESANADKELATLRHERKTKSQIETLRKIFEEMDFSSADTISIHDIERAMAHGHLCDFLESMSISTEDVWTFFMLIDLNGDGLLDLEEFVSGCMQLHGPARSIQLAKMSYENKVARNEIRGVAEELRELSDQVSELVAEVASSARAAKRVHLWQSLGGDTRSLESGSPCREGPT
eukprot:s2778_g4.t3